MTMDIIVRGRHGCKGVPIVMVCGGGKESGDRMFMFNLNIIATSGAGRSYGRFR